MVYCSKCGTKNEEDAEVCASCGAQLYMTRREARRARRVEKECFGLPHGRSVFGLFIGAVIILAGFIFLLQRMGLITEDFEVLWPFIVIVFGILFVVGAIYTLSRR